MRRGTTPTITIELSGIPIERIDAFQLTLKQGSTKLVKEAEDVTIDSEADTVSFTLSQEETLLWKSNRPLQMQLKVKMNSTVLATEIVEVDVEEILNEETL